MWEYCLEWMMYNHTVYPDPLSFFSLFLLVSFLTLYLIAVIVCDIMSLVTVPAKLGS